MSATVTESPKQATSKDAKVTEPPKEKRLTAINFHSSPIGSIPCGKTDPITGKVTPPEYFEQLCQAAMIRLDDEGRWAILSKQEESKELVRGKVIKKSSGSIEQHNKFIMLMDVVRVIVSQQLEKHELPFPNDVLKKLDRDQMFRCILGLQDSITFDLGESAITVDMKPLGEHVTACTQHVYDWLKQNSNMAEYEKPRTFKDNLNIKRPDWAQKRNVQDEDDNHLDKLFD